MPKNILRAMIKKSQAAITPHRQAKTEKPAGRKVHQTDAQSKDTRTLQHTMERPARRLGFS